MLWFNTHFPNIFSESIKMSKKVIGVVAASLVVVAVVTVATIINIKELGQYLNKDVRNGLLPTSSTMINDPGSTTIIIQIYYNYKHHQNK